jgi:hypothetical protein
MTQEILPEARGSSFIKTFAVRSPSFLHSQPRSQGQRQDDKMDGFKRKRISMVRDLKELCICKCQLHLRELLTEAVEAQVQAIFVPRSYNDGSFDIMLYQRDTSFVAQAIFYPQWSSRSVSKSNWIYLMDGSSEEGVVAALEDLWNELLRIVPAAAKGMSSPPLHRVEIQMLTLQTWETEIPSKTSFSKLDDLHDEIDGRGCFETTCLTSDSLSNAMSDEHQ